MATKTNTKIKSIGEKITNTSKVLTAIVTIIGVISGVCAWVSSRFQQAVSAQLSELQQQIETGDRQTELQITRLELLNLIHNQPNNKVEIEKVARHYFLELGGDWYMTGIYSDWATTHSGDISFVIKES